MATIGGILNLVIIKPFTAPINPPVIIETIITINGFVFGKAFKNFPITTADNAIVEETDKSIPPEIRTGSIPKAIIPKTA